MFVLMVLFFIGMAAFIALAASQAQKRDESREREVREATVSESAFGKTIKHDGHWWVLWNSSDRVSHHPDCPCGKSRAEEQSN